ncbi:glycosyltransferase family 39 protein [Actinoplanes sp. TRM 88003]|uniref:Glycosyltransferase family 39 protein n=1 Tax=Paractinoplanes aksuensis TaxID=2939490 RepID=A0ABT1DXL6_9ACTN|nr:glycosyltransferase family 39 protein [Actinoplanes aksuensis]MCO8275609.1 glycosyltransferase family 39 protein [Actinoplanes aksuensis]
MTTTLPVPPPVAPDLPPPPPARRSSDPVWVRPALLALLLATGVLYVWGLNKNGWANAFYSAAVQAGSESWKAFFFGSSDAANSITVDKTPAALWVMALSARIFGVNSWSILVPQALMGVASVGLLFATVRRWYGPVAGLIAGAVLALTPIAVLMFRFNNPDALLVLLMVAGAYATVRAIENGSTKWIMLAGVFVGFGFLAKMLQALLVVPAFALAYLIAGPPKLGKRIGQLLLSGVALVVSAGWYIAIVELVPASMRPYIGGSQNNSILELTLGYNGLGRLNGDETGSVGGGGGGMGGGGMWGSTGLTRMFDSEQGGQISWLLPAALILLVAGLVVTARRARTDRQRAGLILWGGWLLITGLVFSFMQGIFHAYYTVALAPAVGAVVAIGAALLWRHRRNVVAAVTLAATVAVTAWWSFHLLGRSADFLPGLRWVVLIGGLAGAVGLLGALRLPARIAAVAAGVALAAVLAGPAAYAVQTASEGHSGSIPSAGPATSGGFGGGPGRGGRGGFPGGGGGQGGFPGGGAQGGFPGGGGQGGFPGGGAQGGFPGGGAQGGFPGGSFPGGNNQNGTGGTLPGGGNQNGTGTSPGGGTGTLPGGGNGTGQNGGTGNGGTGGTQGGGFGGRGNGGGGMRGGGGLLDAATVSAEMKALLEANADQYTWVAAAVGSQNASGYQLATGDPVMAVGGFNGSDPSPTLTQFQQYVAEGKIHYFIGGGGFGGGRGNSGGSSASSEIATWVAENFTAQTVGNTTVYDLTQQNGTTA